MTRFVQDDGCSRDYSLTGRQIAGNQSYEHERGAQHTWPDGDVS